MVLMLLRDAERPVDLTTLTEQIAARETSHSVDELPSQARKRVYVSLYQTHLPRLADAGLVDYDPDAGTTRRTKEATAVDSYLTADTRRRPWAVYYLSLAFVSLLGIGITNLNVGLFAGVSPVLLTAVLLVAFFALALLHARSELRRRDGRPETAL